MKRLGQHGYTLLEMVTIMAMISVLSGLLLANTRVGDKRQQLRDVAAGYVTAVKQAETLATSSQAVRDLTDTTSPQTPRLAYGVCLTSSAITNSHCGRPGGTQRVDMYQIYARDVADTSYGQRPGRNGPPPAIIANFTLPTDISFDDAQIWVDYFPPGNRMLVNGRDDQGEIEVIARIGNQGTTRRAGLRANAGAVYVK